MLVCQMSIKSTLQKRTTIHNLKWKLICLLKKANMELKENSNDFLMNAHAKICVWASLELFAVYISCS